MEMDVVPALLEVTKADAGKEVMKARRESMQDIGRDIKPAARQIQRTNDQGEYLLRCYRRETRDAEGWQIIRVRQYTYWPPK